MAVESNPTRSAEENRDRMMQSIKWVVYALLLANCGYYAWEDYTAAQHTLNVDYTFYELTEAFAATIDDLAWLLLIGVLEYETYWDESEDSRPLHKILPLVRIACYAMILNTTLAYYTTIQEIDLATPLAESTEVCDFAGQGTSFQRNIRYTTITKENCDTLSNGGGLVKIYDEDVITDERGFTEHTRLSWVDMFENVSWLIIMAMIEFKLQLQNRGSYQGGAFKLSTGAERAAYGIIVLAAIYWFFKGHYVYTWDEFVWIAGFMMIDGNLSEWREEMEEEAVEDSLTT